MGKSVCCQQLLEFVAVFMAEEKSGVEMVDDSYCERAHV